MRVEIRRGKKGDLIGYPFCLIDRREQERVREGEEWEVEVIRTIKDKRGEEIAIVKPIKRVYKLKGGRVYCGSVEIGEAERREEAKYEVNDRGELTEERIIHYFYKGEKLDRERKFRFVPAEEIISDPKLKEIYKKEKEKKIKKLREWIESDRLPEGAKREAEELSKEMLERELAYWKDLTPEKLISEYRQELEKKREEVRKKEEETLKMINSLLSEIESLEGVEVRTDSCIIEASYSYKKRKYTAELVCKGEVLLREERMVIETAHEYYGDSDAGVFVGIGVSKEVYITEKVEKETPNFSKLMEIKGKLKEYEILSKRLQNREKLTEEAIKSVEENKDALLFIKENLEIFVKRGWIGDFPFIKTVKIEWGKLRCEILPVFTKTRYFKVEYHDISEFSDLPVAQQMIEEGMDRGIYHELVVWR